MFKEGYYFVLINFFYKGATISWGHYFVLYGNLTINFFNFIEL